MNTYTLPALASIFITILVILGITSFMESRSTDSAESDAPNVDTPSSKTDDMFPYGTVTLKVGERAVFPDVSIQPLQIVEESRCPSDVNCIQAGKLRVKTQIVSGLGTSTDDIALGNFITTEAEKVEFIGAEPYPVSGAHIPASAYILTFNVTKRPLETLNPPAPVSGSCYVGGCSAQLCTDTPNMASTCEYTETYACYQSATCERQPNGQCGWTPTEELTACLMGT